MKKFAIVMVLMLCMILSLGLVACSGSGELATPKNVAINGNTLSWDEVKNASGYVVKLDGKDEVEVQDTSYTYMTDVRALILWLLRLRVQASSLILSTQRI